MRRKRLHHYADVMCKMFMGWRISDDLEILSELPDGKLTINLLEPDAIHNVVGPLKLHITYEIQTWLRAECQKENISFPEIRKAELTVDMDTTRVKTDKKRVVCFTWNCRALIQTDEKEYTASANETHKWHNRERPQTDFPAYAGNPRR